MNLITRTKNQNCSICYTKTSSVEVSEKSFTASIIERSFAFHWFANSTIKMVFLVTSPISIIIPTTLKIFTVSLKYHCRIASA